MNIDALLRDTLRPVSAPEALWDRVWQPRMAKPRPRVPLVAGFATAAALAIAILAVPLPDLTPRGFRPQRPGVVVRSAGAAEIAGRVERRAEVERALNRPEPRPVAASAESTDAGCSVCHAAI